MNKTWFLAVSVLTASPVLAAPPVTPGATPEVQVGTTTIAASAILAPGRYVVTVAPYFDDAMGGRLQAAVGKISGLAQVEVKGEDDTLHFSVKEGSKVRTADIQRVVAKTHTGGVISAPVLEGSLTPRLGL
jgi:hypothetical protein